MNSMRQLACLLMLVASLPMQAQWTQEAAFNQRIGDLEVFGQRLFIAGGFTQRDGKATYWATSFDGTTFYNQPSPLGGIGLRRLEVYNGSLYATGALTSGFSTGVYRWTGSTWTTIGNFTKSHTAIYSDSTNLYVGSDFGQIHVMDANESFTPMPSMDDDGDNISAFIQFQGELIVAGRFKSSDSVTLNNIARWDGTKWQPLGDGVNGAATSLAVYNSELYVGGGFKRASGTPARFIAKWDGTSWSDVGGSMTSDQSFLNGVKALLVFDGELYAGGDFPEMGGVPANDLAKWDGSQWTGMNVDSSSFYVDALEEFNGKLYVGMYYSPPSAKLFGFSANNTGMDDLVTNEWTMYPNPASEEVFIDLGQEISRGEKMVTILSTEGQVVRRQSTRETAFSFPLSSISPGFYLVEIRESDTNTLLGIQKLMIR